MVSAPGADSTRASPPWLLQHLACVRQAEAHAKWLCREQGLEEVLWRIGLESRPAVLDADLDPVVGAARRHTGRPAPGHRRFVADTLDRLARVVDHVQHRMDGKWEMEMGTC